jgi:hypothetical protein
MKQPKVMSEAAKRGASKQKKQLAVLGVLGLVLVAVVVTQVSDPGGDSAADTPVAEALTGAEGAPVADASGSSSSPLSVPDNEALSAAGDGESVKRNPFQSFWNSDASIEATVQEIPAPSVTLNGTMISDKNDKNKDGKSVAIIDGQIRLLGDLIQGWKLVSIGSREIGLESPTKAVVSVQMPLLKLATRRVP